MSDTTTLSDPPRCATCGGNRPLPDLTHSFQVLSNYTADSQTKAYHVKKLRERLTSERSRAETAEIATVELRKLFDLLLAEFRAAESRVRELTGEVERLTLRAHGLFQAIGAIDYCLPDVTAARVIIAACFPNHSHRVRQWLRRCYRT